MNKLFGSVKVLVWDFDGTFYKPNPTLFHAVRESEYAAIMKHTGWSREKTIAEFQKLHKVTMQSATAVIAVLCDISIARAAVESEDQFDRRTYLKRDDQLIAMFAKLKKFRHVILANGVIAKHKETLRVLGISPDTFEDFVSAETVGVTKPDPAGFVYILKKTGLPPNTHMMIGDRELVDLAPAKALGMHTCLVWSETKSEIADVTLPTVYEVPMLFSHDKS
jgi:HAD superfamily hydrolase (TIGR01549 family)